jgi:hypothetical protein
LARLLSSIYLSQMKYKVDNWKKSNVLAKFILDTICID